MIVLNTKSDDPPPAFAAGRQISGTRVFWRSTLLHYGVAAVAVSCALEIRLLLVPVVGEVAPYLPFTLAIIIASRYGGRMPGFAATILSAGAVTWFLLEPRQSLSISSLPERWGLALFLLVGCAISFLIGALHTTLCLNAASEARLQWQLRIIDTAHDAIITTDSQRRIVNWNQGAVQLYGWKEAEVSGRTLHDILKTTNYISIQEIDETLLREGQWEGELHHTTRDGREIVTDSRQILMRSPNGSPLAILEINRDMTERKHAVDRLRESESLCRAILDSVTESIYLKDCESRIVMANPAYLRALAKSSEQVVGKTPLDYLINPLDAAMILKHDRRVIECAETLVTEEPMETASGKQVYLSTKSPWRNAEGRIIGLVGVSVNVTEQKRAEDHRALALEAARMGSWEYQIEHDEWVWDETCARLFGVPASAQVTPAKLGAGFIQGISIALTNPLREHWGACITERITRVSA